MPINEVYNSGMRKDAVDRTHFAPLVEEIKAGRLTRAEAAARAAEASGCSPNTFLSWLRSSGATKQLKDVRLTAGANHKDSHAKNNPEVERAYQEALAEVARGKVSVRSIAARYESRGVSYVWLLARSKKLPKAPDNVGAETSVPDNVVA